MPILSQVGGDDHHGQQNATTYNGWRVPLELVLVTAWYIRWVRRGQEDEREVTPRDEEFGLAADGDEELRGTAQRERR